MVTVKLPAILDLARLNFLAAKQSEVFGEIRLVVLKSLTMEKYLEVRDQDLLPQTSGDFENEPTESN